MMKEKGMVLGGELDSDLKKKPVEEEAFRISLSKRKENEEE